MILGMFALSDVGVIADKVDIMLKVGLGPLGKVRKYLLVITKH